ncbi:Unknown protein [Striga hermonthica]|uniref:No apical meristem-associated C-terminal domain-containing protein n=1 Tax=Striga hermonthica TaxID=68872 RepID=A0A9N7MT44_STRHE|nr:Unknown protein [Striga hermonthica]
MPPRYGIPNAFGMPYQQENFMSTGFSSSSTEVPRPCTAPKVEGLDNICLDTDSEKGKEVEPKRCGKVTAMPWTHEEDVLLCRAFCTISSDPVIGAQQTSDDFWRGITQYYNEAGQARNLIQRTMESAKSHFYVFHRDCIKFNASINRFWADQRSGENDAIVLQNALMEWNSKGKKKGGFKWLHCWEVLKDNAKFDGASHTSRGGKKARISDIGDQTSGSGQDVEPSGDVEDRYVRRPIGQKAAKAGKRKGKTTAKGSTGPDVGRLLAEIGEVKEIHLKKQKDLEKLVRIESWKTYREMLKEDTSTMTEEELQAH